MEKKIKKDDLFIYLKFALGILATTLLMLKQFHCKKNIRHFKIENLSLVSW